MIGQNVAHDGKLNRQLLMLMGIGLCVMLVQRFLSSEVMLLDLDDDPMWSPVF